MRTSSSPPTRMAVLTSTAFGRPLIANALVLSTSHGMKEKWNQPYSPIERPCILDSRFVTKKTVVVQNWNMKSYFLNKNSFYYAASNKALTETRFGKKKLSKLKWTTLRYFHIFQLMLYQEKNLGKRFFQWDRGKSINKISNNKRKSVSR